MCNINISNAQTEPEPYWSSDRNKLKEGDNFGYAVGRGQGRNRDEAEKKALRKAIDDAIIQLRYIEVPEHDIDSFAISIKTGRTNESAKLICSCYFKINNNDSTYQVYILCRFRKHIYREWGDNDEYIDCGETAFEEQREKYYRYIEESKNIDIESVSICQPAVFNNFKVKTPLHKGLSIVSAVGIVGGFGCSVCYGVGWYTKNKDYSKYKDRTSLDEIDMRNSLKNKRDHNRTNFWISLGVMCTSYGLNILDNSLWNKNAKKSNIALKSVVTPNYNGFSLTYNF